MVRELNSVRLLDVSPVVSPAYLSTTANVYADGPAGSMGMRLQLAEAAIHDHGPFATAGQSHCRGREIADAAEREGAS